jgi:hypothetical protein
MASQRDVLLFRPLAHFLKSYVLPGLELRVKSGAVPMTALPVEIKAFKVVPEPMDGGGFSSQVDLNEEVKLEVRAKATRPIEKGEMVALADIHPDECYIVPPMHEGKPLAYFLYLRQFLDHRVFFDFTPNSPGDASNLENYVKLKYPVAEIADTLRFLQTVRVPDQLNALMAANWPPAPGYYPTVVSQLHSDPNAVASDNFVEFVAVAYGRDYWDQRLTFWKETNFYDGRLAYLETAIDRYFEGDFISSICVIVPQFEGITKAYLQSCKIAPKSGFPDCVDQLKRVLLSRKIILFPRQVIDVILNYLENGHFWRNSRTISDPSSMVNRHGLSHGAFTGFECREIALKYLILLDALDFLLLHDKILAGSL